MPSPFIPYFHIEEKKDEEKEEEEEEDEENMKGKDDARAEIQ